VGVFSEGACLPWGRVTRRQHRAPRVLGAGTLASFARHSDFGREGVKALSPALRGELREGSRRAPRERSEQRGCKPAKAGNNLPLLSVLYLGKG